MFVPMPEASPEEKPFMSTSRSRDESRASSVIHGTISHNEVISLPLMGFLLLLGKFFLLDLNFSAVLHPSAFKRWFISIFSFVLHGNDRDFNVVQKIRKALLK